MNGLDVAHNVKKREIISRHEIFIDKHSVINTKSIIY